MTAKKLKHYFQEHDIRVVCAAPISDIINNKNASGRVAKWAIELAPYTPSYERRDVIKYHVLADFLVDWAEIQYQPPPLDLNYWRMHFDGSRSMHGLGAGVVLTSPKGDQLKYVLQIHFAASNNVAEYEALVFDLQKAISLKVVMLKVVGDSEIAVQQVRDTIHCLSPHLKNYQEEVR